MKKNETTSHSINLIGSGTAIKGDVNSNGDVRIDGRVVGNINSKGKVVIGVTSNIEGDIICKNADISGAIQGNIIVQELLLLKATARLNGNITTNKIAIEPGANFSGSCQMQNAAKDITNEERAQPQTPEKTLK